MEEQWYPKWSCGPSNDGTFAWWHMLSTMLKLRIKKTAADNVRKYWNEASTIVKRNFYVDDMLKSFPDVEEAVDMVNKVREPCLEGGFNLRKFTSNNVDLLKNILIDLKKDGIENKDVKLGNLTHDKAPGVKWNVKDGTLGFIIKMKNKPATWWGLPAALSSIYNSLGLGAPFLLKERWIIQTRCKENLKWDDSRDDEITQE